MSITPEFIAAITASVVFAGRNLKLWSSYVGKDPNVSNLMSDRFPEDDGRLIPQPRNWTFRLNLGF